MPTHLIKAGGRTITWDPWTYYFSLE